MSFVRCYLQCHLVGVSTLAIGYRKNDKGVEYVEEMTLDDVLLAAQDQERKFDPNVYLARAHGILDVLLGHFRSMKQSVKDNVEFELRIDKRKNATISCVADPQREPLPAQVKPQRKTSLRPPR